MSKVDLGIPRLPPKTIVGNLLSTRGPAYPIDVAEATDLLGLTIITPQSYGAVGDGTTDDTTAIESALDAHRTTPSSVLQIKKIYGISRAIQIGPGDNIVGVGKLNSGFKIIGNGSHHGIFGSPLDPPHHARLSNFSVWANQEVSSPKGQYDGIRIHDAKGIVISEVAVYDGDGICIRLVDCEHPVIQAPYVGSFTEARYLSNPAWGVFLDGCAHGRIENGYGYRTGQGFSINGDDSYRRTYAYVSSTGNNELTCLDPNFFTNLATDDEVRIYPIDGVGTMPLGLTAQATYYVNKSGDESSRIIKLKDSGGSEIDITTTGSGTNFLWRDKTPLFQIDKNPRTTTATPDNSTNQIAVDSVFYRSCTVGYPVFLRTTGTVPTGLSLDKIYYVIRPTTNQIKLATSVANANAGTAVDFSDDGTGTLILNLAKVSSFTRSGNNLIVDQPLYTILRTGFPVRVMSDGGSVPSGLTNNQTYYVILTDTEGYIKLASSSANAYLGTAIDLNDSGSGTLMIALGTSFGACLSDSISQRPAGMVRGNRIIGCVIERHDNHAFNINSGQDNMMIGCVASDLEEYTTPMGGGTLVARASFQAKHSTGSGADRNGFLGCHALRCGIGFQAQETVSSFFEACVVDEAEYDGFVLNSAEEAIISNVTINRAKRYAFWFISSPRVQTYNYNVLAHPNNSSILFNLDSSGNAMIGTGRHTGTFTYVLDIDANSGFFEVLSGFRTRGLPINIVPTTGSYPYIRSIELDLSDSTDKAMGIVGDIHVTRVRFQTSVATSGTPAIRVGVNASTTQFANDVAPSATLAGIVNTMATSGTGYLAASNKVLISKVQTTGTGKVIVEVSGIPSQPS